MDNKEVYLTISINYDGKSHTKKSTDFISFEDIKNISKNEFNIPEEDCKFMKLSFKNDINNETIFIENDSDIIFKSTEKDEYNYEMTIDLTIDKSTSIQIEEKKIKDEQNEEKIIENQEKKDEINDNKEMIDNKDDNINMNYNNNDKNKILNKENEDEKKEKLAKFLKKLVIKNYKNIINKLEKEINNDENNNENENKNITEKIPLKKQFEICNCNNFLIKKNLDFNQLINLEDKGKNTLKSILEDIKEKPQICVNEIDNYNKEIKEGLENYFSMTNKNFSLLIEKYKKIIENYANNQKTILNELQKIKKQLDDKKNEVVINLAPKKNIKDEENIKDIPYRNKNAKPDINNFLYNKNK